MHAVAPLIVVAAAEPLFLPTLNAWLNGTAAVLLVGGFLAIRSRRIGLHKACMLTATAVSAAFLVSYLIHHYRVGSVRYEGGARPLYLGILLTHTVLATVNVPLIVVTLTLALRGRFEKHKRIAPFTLASWLYVSVTGIVVYWMLYR